MKALIAADFNKVPALQFRTGAALAYLELCGSDPGSNDDHSLTAQQFLVILGA